MMLREPRLRLMQSVSVKRKKNANGKLLLMLLPKPPQKKPPLKKPPRMPRIRRNAQQNKNTALLLLFGMVAMDGEQVVPVLRGLNRKALTRPKSKRSLTKWAETDTSIPVLG